ncbi:MAG: hypothetical protein NC084_02805 [Bacteroides sp.]|nr:hypothetical protein [Eubacterium sp.]MCM1417445.1 hypothetical protein [Roseburia sp.]MCM1461625.1 hypothetical protein [Bacteroides sp.]
MGLILSLTVFVSCIATRIGRSDWVVTTAEITFVALPDGLVFGTFEDREGIIREDQALYRDLRFMPKLIISGGPIVNPEPYYGKTVRIMYDPERLSTGEPGEDGIDSYDNRLILLIGSGGCFGLFLLVLALLFRKWRQRRRSAMDFVKNHRLFQ